MRKFLPYGVSAAAMLAAISLSYAETPEQGEKAGATESKKSESVAPQHSAPTREQKAAPANRNESKASEQKNEAAHGRSAQTEGKASDQKGEANRQRASENERQRDATKSDAQRAESERQPNDRQKASNVAGAAKAGNAGVNDKEGGAARRVSIHIGAPQKTELHQVLVSDRAVRSYHRSDIHFAIEAGERVPDSVEFFAPPPRFVELVPELQSYMIVVVDNQILVIDPSTREIVDVLDV